MVESIRDRHYRLVATLEAGRVPIDFRYWLGAHHPERVIRAIGEEACAEVALDLIRAHAGETALPCPMESLIEQLCLNDEAAFADLACTEMADLVYAFCGPRED